MLIFKDLDQAQGNLAVDGKGNAWIIPEQNPAFHLDGMLISVPGGRVAHFSTLPQPVRLVYGSEIQW